MVETIKQQGVTTMSRLIWATALALLFGGCVTAPRVGDPLAGSFDCAAKPLGFAVAGGKALHSCPFVSSADGSSGAFVEVEQGIVRAVLDKQAAKAWVVSNRCSALGVEADTPRFAACAELVSDLLVLWDALEMAEERAATAEQDVQRADFQQRVTLQRVMVTGPWYDW